MNFREIGQLPKIITIWLHSNFWEGFCAFSVDLSIAAYSPYFRSFIPYSMCFNPLIPSCKIDFEFVRHSCQSRHQLLLNEVLRMSQSRKSLIRSMKWWEAQEHSYSMQLQIQVWIICNKLGFDSIFGGTVSFRWWLLACCGND